MLLSKSHSSGLHLPLNGLDSAAAGGGLVLGIDYRYQEIAELAVRVTKERAAKAGGGAPQRQKPQQQDLMVQVAQELYRVVLFAVFFLQIWVISQLPRIGVQCFLHLRQTRRSQKIHLAGSSASSNKWIARRESE